MDKNPKQYLRAEAIAVKSQDFKIATIAFVELRVGDRILKSEDMPRREAEKLAVELNDKMMAHDFDKLVKEGKLSEVETHIMERVVRLGEHIARARDQENTSRVFTVNAILTALGTLSSVAMEQHSMGSDGEQLSEELFNEVCTGAVVVLLELSVLSAQWDIDIRGALRYFLDGAEGRSREGKEEEDIPIKGTLLKLVVPKGTNEVN